MLLHYVNIFLGTGTSLMGLDIILVVCDFFMIDRKCAFLDAFIHDQYDY